MILREPCLPPGWYPRQKTALVEFLTPYGKSSMDASAAIAPHAGWYYCGSTAALAVASLDRKAETVALIGGHLPSGMPVLIADEDAVKTPFGTMEIDSELRNELEKRISGKIKPIRPDSYNDNTIEVLLPMVHYFFPGSALLWLRFPAELSSFEAGKLLDQAAGALGRRIVVLASADLTHYGDNYGFSPKGSGKAALEWVKNVNDAAFIKAVLEENPSLVLERAEKDFSSCSAGAVLGALGFVSSGEKNVRLLDYRTSADLSEDEPPGSFVGYAAIIWN
jgi:hypothetical protein